MFQRITDCVINSALTAALLSMETPLFSSLKLNSAHPGMPQAQLSSRINPIGIAQLHSAIEGFKNVLDTDQRQDFESSNVQPDVSTVLNFTAHLDEINSERQSRCIATRLQTVLQSVQQFSTIVETFVSSNPRIAALVWGSLKFALLVIPHQDIFCALLRTTLDRLEFWLVFRETVSTLHEIWQALSTLCRVPESLFGFD